MNIVRITTINYNLFDNLLYWQLNGFEKEYNSPFAKIPDDAFSALSNPHFHLYAAMADEKAIGWASYNFVPKIGKFVGKGYLVIEDLWVAPPYRRQGVAAALIENAAGIMEASGAISVRVHAPIDNFIAQALCEQKGYAYIDSIFIMEKHSWDKNKEGKMLTEYDIE